MFDVYNLLIGSRSFWFTTSSSETSPSDLFSISTTVAFLAFAWNCRFFCLNAWMSRLRFSKTFCLEEEEDEEDETAVGKKLGLSVVVVVWRDRNPCSDLYNTELFSFKGLLVGPAAVDDGDLSVVVDAPGVFLPTMYTEWGVLKTVWKLPMMASPELDWAKFFFEGSDVVTDGLPGLVESLPFADDESELSLLITLAFPLYWPLVVGDGGAVHGLAVVVVVVVVVVTSPIPTRMDSGTIGLVM